MQPSTSRIRESVRGWLDAEGRGQTSPDLAVTVERLLRRLITHLGRVVGDGGVRAMLARSVRLQWADHPALRTITLDDADLPACIAATLRGMPQNHALEAAEALLTTFIEVLASLIGATLTWRLLGDIWPAGADPLPISRRNGHER